MNTNNLIDIFECIRINYLPKWDKSPAYEKIARELFLTETWHEMQISKDKTINFWFDIVHSKNDGLEFIFGAEAEDAKFYKLDDLLNKIQEDYFNFIESDKVAKNLILNLIFKINSYKELELDTKVINIYLDAYINASDEIIFYAKF